MPRYDVEITAEVKHTYRGINAENPGQARQFATGLWVEDSLYADGARNPKYRVLESSETESFGN